MKTSTLHDVARGCWNGACNPHGIIRSLAEGMAAAPHCLTPEDRQDLSIIVDHLGTIIGSPGKVCNGDFSRYQP